MRLLVVIVTLVFFSPRSLVSQSLENDSSGEVLHCFQFEDAPALSCLFTYFPPFFIQHGIELKEFVRSEMFRSLRQKYGDVRAVDAIYIRAMQMTNNNTAIALLIAMFATFDHRLLGFKVPVVQLFFPLTNESVEQFQRRVHNLPSALYADTPPTKSGDRDKLQHFFGSAFLTYIFESRDVAERFGYFVEEGEDAFIVDGVMDSRDVRANRQGQNFGAHLLQNERYVPSTFLKLQHATRGVTMLESLQCAGVW